MNVSAVIPTRGDVDLSEILDAMPREWQKVIWDNRVRDDLAVYGRYAAIDECEHDIVMVQDDDCVLAPEAFDALVTAYKPRHVVCNMPLRFRDTGFYGDHALVGFGAIFDRGLPQLAFDRFTEYGITVPNDTDPTFFYRTADIVFTALSERILVDLPYTDLPWATADTRMYRQPNHVGERTRMLELVRRVRDA